MTENGERENGERVMTRRHCDCEERSDKAGSNLLTNEPANNRKKQINNKYYETKIISYDNGSGGDGVRRLRRETGGRR